MDAVRTYELELQGQMSAKGRRFTGRRELFAVLRRDHGFDLGELG